MTTDAIDIADREALLARLAAHQTLGHAPREELEWLVAHGELRRFPAGTVYLAKGQPVDEMAVLLSGRTVVHVERASGRRHLLETSAGAVTGALPYSRVVTVVGDVVMEDTTDALLVSRDHFPEMIRECPVITATIVHVMLDRARQFASTDWQDEKMVSLGRLSAGMAHELNNPASAAARSAKLLNEVLSEVEEASRLLGAINLTVTQRGRLLDLRDRSLIPATTGVFSAIERSDREEEIVSWLAAHGADTSRAAALAEGDVTRERLDEFAEVISGTALDAALRWIAADRTARALVRDVERATDRIYDLVSAVKRFTYMDRAVVMEPTDVGQGLADTVSVLAAKAKQKSVSVRLDVPADLPRVSGFAGELNQVWSNLIDNALDAVESSGHVTVTASRDGDTVVVCVTDDGPGIPPEIEGQIFDPFFTTKPIGAGTGLGLDISRRIVRSHHGQIGVESRPGRTEFRVSIPGLVAQG